MKKFIIRCDIKSASGWQEFSVMAEDERDALSRYESGEGEFLDEEVMVDSLREPEVVDTVDDRQDGPR